MNVDKYETFSLRKRLTLNRPMGCTGTEAGLLTTTKYSLMCRILMGLSNTCSSVSNRLTNKKQLHSSHVT